MPIVTLCCWRVPISMLHGAATPCPRILAHSLKCCVAPAPEPRAWPPDTYDPVDEASLDEASLLREITPATARRTPPLQMLTFSAPSAGINGGGVDQAHRPGMRPQEAAQHHPLLSTAGCLYYIAQSV